MLEYLNNTEYAEWVRESLGWPIALTIHAFGTATVSGILGSPPRSFRQWVTDNAAAFM